MYIEKIDKTTADNVVRVLCDVAKCQNLQYYFLTDHVCNTLELQHFYNLANPLKSVHNTTRLTIMLRNRRKVNNHVVMCKLS